ncbi:MAG: ABC transporter permease subunit, partial [Planctomycetes bacterium]|nr:ABC transporter permease subunit [Planctomycetota bacterium]
MPSDTRHEEARSQELRRRAARRSDALLRGASVFGALIAAALAWWIAAWLVRESAPSLAAVGIGGFLGDARWNPAGGEFGLLPMVATSVTVAVGALLLALPLALATALFLLGYAPPALGSAMRLLLDLLAAVPSVVVGFFGLIVLVPWLARIAPPGASLLAGILVLALMVLPTLAVMVEAALAAMPAAERSAAAALGLSRATVLLALALPRA